MKMAWLLFIFMSLLSLHNCFATMEPKIDIEHLAKYPNCGQLQHTSKARIANAIPSFIRYPWAVLVTRTFTRPQPDERNCGGIIITKKY